MKGSYFLLKRNYNYFALLMVAVSAMAAPEGTDSPLSDLRPPYREQPNFTPNPGFDPCLFSLAFTGCISTRKALRYNQQALAEERIIVGQFKALMSMENERSQWRIATINDLTPSAVEASRLIGDASQIPEILLNGHIAYADYVSQIQTLRAENKSLRLSITEKDGQLATSQKEVERLVANTAELEARVKERDILSREYSQQHKPLTGADASNINAATTGLSATVEQGPLPLPSGDYASGVAFSQEVLRAIDINSALGIRTDKNALIAGFSDKMSGAVKYSTRALSEAMSDKQKEVASAREKLLSQQMQQGHSAAMRFLASPGGVKTPQGFLYRIERRGDAPLKKNVPLRLIVKESLADGTSLLDMVAEGSELKQNVDDMPPIFKEVIGKLALHGSATIMVPPELAYGEEGKPPQIPPGATLIYWFEIKGY